MRVASRTILGVGMKIAATIATPSIRGVMKYRHGASLVVAIRVNIAACAFAFGTHTHLV